MNYAWKQFEQNDQISSPPRRNSRVEELQDQLDRMLGRLRIAVVHGGNKETAGSVINATTNVRSWKSYEAVAHDIAAALTRLGCREVAVLPEDMRLGERLRRDGTHLVWLNSGGVQGHNAIAHAPATLEMLGIPYIGHNPLTAAALDTKHVFKRQLIAAGVATAPFMVWQLGDGPFQPERSARFGRAFHNWSGAYVVKPVSGRASLHVHHVPSRAQLPEIVAAVQEKTGNAVLVEGYLAGREYCVAVCGPLISVGRRLERLRQPFAFACVERVLGQDEQIFTSMDVSPITADRVRPLQGIDGEIAERLRELARQVFREIGLETLVRLDVRADAEGELYVLEANPKPDLKAPTAASTSLICAGLAQEGMSYDDLILSLLADKIDLMFTCSRGANFPVLALAA